MSNTETNIKKWLKVFIVLSYIIIVTLGLSLTGCAIMLIITLTNKNILDYKLDDSTTLLSLLEDVGISSRGDMLALLVGAIIYFAISLVISIMILKSLKTNKETLQFFDKTSTAYMRKTAKFIYIACLLGFICDNILLSINGSLTSNFDYTSLIFTGFVIHFLSYVFAYANEKAQKQVADETDQEK